MTRQFHAHKAFQEEALEELLPELEHTLLKLGEDPDDPDLIHRVFRSLHTLKGSGAMFGFDRLSELAHEMETVFDHVRNNSLEVDNHLVEQSLAAKDKLQLLTEDPDTVSTAAVEEMKHAFQKMTPDAPAAGSSENEAANDRDTDPSPAWQAYHIRFKPRADIFASGTNPLFLLDELSELGPARIIAHVNDLPLLEDLEPESCYTWWDIILATDSPAGTLQDVFIFVEDECDLSIEKIGENFQPGHEKAVFDQLAHLLTENSDIGSGELKAIFSEQMSTDGENAQNASESDESAAAADRTSPSPDAESGKGAQSAKSISSMRVQAAKLDKLVNLVGELVIAQTSLRRLAEEKEDENLTEISELMERLTSDLRDNTLDIRMMPIGSSFGKFKRVVWDLSSEQNKTVELITEGAATELDKTVIERLDDPLMHLLRNCIDHGIEPPDERDRQGKPRRGRIVFSAEHSGGNVIITIADDGRGIEAGAVRNRAIEKGLLAPEASPSEAELLNLIFEPGFSTSRRVSDISGRGVGMDVVKQNINALRGKVTVSSEKGRGTAVRMRIPLTLAIIDGLQVRIGEEYFIVPLAAVSECLEAKQEETGRPHRKDFVNWRDQLVPFLSLRDWFAINGIPPENKQVVIVSAEKRQVGLVVDDVIGLQQTVIKNLGKAHQDVPGISGATIQGDGSIALILDVELLVQRAEENLQSEQ